MCKKTISVVLILSVILTLLCPIFTVSASTTNSVKIKNVIFMIPDGGAMAPFYLADEVKQDGGLDKTKYPNATPVEKGEMYIKQYLVGAETTYSANKPITDSAASGTALSTGYKTNNYYIGIDPQAKPHANILEACQDAGKNTGIVVTYEWTNATPAAFSAHDISRENMTTMSEQIVNQGIDVVFGNTHSAFKNEEWFTDDALIERGYKVIKDKTALEDVKAGDRIWGKLPAAYYDYKRAATTPNLAELTEKAITALDDGNENGFFLMVEGSAVDGGGHSNDAVRMVSEYLAFDAACKVAIEYAKDRTDTIVVIAPDHDTGGLLYDYSNIETIVDEIKAGTNPSDVLWETDGHTARNGGVFMYLPEGVAYPTGIDSTMASQVASDFYNAYGNFSSAYPDNAVNVINNIDIPKYIAKTINVDLDAVTNKLFIDVTNRGTYDPDTEVFTFSNNDISIKRNTSTATIQGASVDLDGEIAVYIEGRFYVPQKLLTSAGEAVDVANNIQTWVDYNTGEVTFSGNIGFSKANIMSLVTMPGATLDDVSSGDEIVALVQGVSDAHGDYELSTVIERLEGEYTVYINYKGGTDTPKHRSFALKNVIPTLSVCSDGSAVSKMTQLTAGDVLDVTVSGFECDEDFKSMIVVAQYANNVLLDAVCTSATGSSVYFGDEITDSVKILEGADKVKVLYWNANTYAPLIASYTID